MKLHLFPVAQRARNHWHNITEISTSKLQVCKWLFSDLQSPAKPLPIINVSYQLGTYRDLHSVSLLSRPTYKTKKSLNTVC